MRSLSCLIDGKGVCVGYSLALVALLRLSGEEAKIVCNSHHAWVAVKMKDRDEWIQIEPQRKIGSIGECKGRTYRNGNLNERTSELRRKELERAQKNAKAIKDRLDTLDTLGNVSCLLR